MFTVSWADAQQPIETTPYTEPGQAIGILIIIAIMTIFAMLPGRSSWFGRGLGHMTDVEVK
ncbi:hypothetical protein A2348_00870 [Candidatus Uhrbacteria bacterium RIFOXYB12_FULL_58_10]|uniref:Uncharacterized protein n=1 Tax=Candidatus Uhrbacteria bacterium RIFOXYB2_FULL_57_15 TaxID=1802422 RepID=A0A1F7W6A1_9BACT|nr:MAG: hypothetical protein A2348_00870 [Candidatus Uhrbacteria bacterium RIFOXYB12_FULL_58_10]OGL98342.1 MAG: hypothetical protein A2304_01440 [Candidatus Uhrbacteria bacterium RIFOXYB2_FULL_57_15]